MKSLWLACALLLAFSSMSLADEYSLAERRFAAFICDDLHLDLERAFEKELGDQRSEMSAAAAKQGGSVLLTGFVRDPDEEDGQIATGTFFAVIASPRALIPGAERDPLACVRPLDAARSRVAVVITAHGGNSSTLRRTPRAIVSLTLAELAQVRTGPAVRQRLRDGASQAAGGATAGRWFELDAAWTGLVLAGERTPRQGPTPRPTELDDAGAILAPPAVGLAGALR